MPDAVRIVAVGDLLLCGRYDEILRAGRADGVFAAFRQLVSPSDLVVGNMECPLASRGAARDDKLCLRGDPGYADVLAAAGFGVLSLANNHLFDYGLDGFVDTRAHLSHAGIGTVGAGENLEAATRPLILEQNGFRVAFLAFCHASTKPSDLATTDRAGIAPLDHDAVLGAVRRWRGEVDQIVLLLHWGLEYSPLPTPEQVELAHAAVDAGAGLVLGHHSHMLQGIETYRGAVIAYSLGNCTDSDVDWQGPSRRYESRMTDTDREGLALVVELTRDGARVLDRQPLWLDDAGCPVPAPAERAGAILAMVDERSASLAAGDLTQRWEQALVAKRVTGPLRHWWSRGTLWDKVRGFRPGQLKTLYLLMVTFVRIRLSRAESRWSLFNPRNDSRPMPYGGDDETRNRP